MSDREPGWYWVKVIEAGHWGCFKWNGRAWQDDAQEYPMDLFDVVGPRIPTPDEEWQAVPVEPELAMQKAYFSSIDQHMARVQTDPRFGRFDNQRLAYRAMLAAAPKP